MVFTSENPNGMLNASSVNQNMKTDDETEKVWEHAWTTSEIRKNSSNWTLAGDVGLLNHLKQFSNKLISRTHEMEKVVDALVHKSKVASAKVNNVINDFQMLSNLQFVENRVYDEEAADPEPSPTQETTQKTKEQREAEMVPRITLALELGISVLDKAFERIDMEETSDSEDDDEESQGHTVLEPKDLYEHRPLPFIIGSKEFESDDLAGLHNIYEEDISTDLSTQDENISASAESETESEEESEDELPPQEPLILQVHKETKSSIDTLQAKYSDSEGSDLFDNEPEENGYVSDPLVEPKPSEKAPNSLIEELKRKTNPPLAQSDVPKPQSIQQPIQKVEKNENEDLFTNSDSFMDEEEDSPFRKKTGLFTSDSLFGPTAEEKDEGSLFEDEEDDFSTQVTKSKPKPKSFSSKAPEFKPVPVMKEEPPAIKSDDESDLFGDNDDDSENDLFSSIKVSSTKVSKPIEKKNTPVKIVGKPEPKAAPVPTMPVKKPFDLSDNTSRSNTLFDDDSDDDLFSSNAASKKKSFGFGGDDDNDLFSAKPPSKPTQKVTKPAVKEEIKAKRKEEIKAESPSLFEESDNFDLFGSQPLVKPKAVINVQPQEPKKAVKKEVPQAVEQSSLFEESDSFDLFHPQSKTLPVTNKIPQNTEKTFESTTVVKKEVPSLFEDSDNFDLFGPSKRTAEKSVVKKIEKKPAVIAPSTVVDQKATSETDSPLDFEQPVTEASTLPIINKDRIKGQAKRRKPTRKGRQSRLIADSDNIEDVPKTQHTDEEPDIFSSVKPTPLSDKAVITVPTVTQTKNAQSTTHKATEQSKKSLMSQLMAEAKSSKIAKRGPFSDSDDDNGETNLFSNKTTANQGLGSKFAFASPTVTKASDVFAKDDSVAEKKTTAPNTLLSDSTSDDDLFSSPAFPDFKTNISEKNSVFDDDDDDIFKSAKAKNPSDKSSADGMIDADDDIFAGVDKEKYEMFPTQPFDDDDDEDDDDIFSNLDKPSVHKAAQEKSQAVKKNKPDSDDLFSDPLGGLALNN